MNRNRTLAATLTFVAVVALALGTFFALGGSGTDAALAPDGGTEQQLTVTARDTQQQPLSGVDVRLLDSTDTAVATGTTRGNGEATLSFTPAAGDYAVVATAPKGYASRDDKDGGSSHQGSPTCDDVFLCIYLTATVGQDGSVLVKIPDVTVDQQQDLDDLWFKLAPPIAPVEDESQTAGDPSDDDLLLGDPSDDVLIGGGDDILGDPSDDVLIGGDGLFGGGDDVLGDPVPEAPGLRQLCFDVVHQPVAEQGAASGIWVRGEVYGLEGGWIWVQGPTLNGGEPIEVPVVDGRFDGPLGINSYGDHPVERFELLPEGDGAEPIDLLPTLNDGPGNVVPVTGAEGPAFEQGCFDFDAPVLETPAAELPAADAPAPAPVPVAPVLDGRQTVEAFLDGFIADHATQDVDGLLDTLHPAIPLAFGETECVDYVTRTTGSLAAAEVGSVGALTDVDLDSPAGPITIPDVLPFEVEFTLTDGSTMSSEANLALLDGEPHWLTRCGR
ncbi:MAG: Ig-like domain-containing protein [Actinomycetota bacterium]